MVLRKTLFGFTKDNGKIAIWLLPALLLLTQPALYRHFRSNWINSFQTRAIFSPGLPLQSVKPQLGEPASVLITTGIAYLAVHEPLEAIPFLKVATEKIPHEFQDWLFLGQALYESGDVNGAVNAWKHVRGAADWLILQGIEDQNQGNFEKAATEYELSSQVDPLDGRAYRLLGDVNKYLGRWDASARAYRNAASFTKDPYQKALLEGSAALITADWNTALSAYQRAADIQPAQSEPYYWQGYIWYWAYQDANQAKALMEKAVVLQPSQPEPYILMVQICSQEKDYPCADEWFQNGQKIAPNNIELIYEMARSQDLRGNYQNVISYTDHILELSPTYLPALFLKGNALIQSGEPTSALQIYQQAAAVNPNNPEAQAGLVQALFAAGKPCEALESGQQVITNLDSSDPSTVEIQKIITMAKASCHP